MDPDLAGFIGLAALMVTLVAWLRLDMGGRMDRLDERMGRIETTQAEHGAALSAHGAMLSAHGAMLSEQGERLTRIEATQAEQGERLTRIETAQAEQGERLTRIEATQAEHGERLTRVETAQAEQGERLTRIEATQTEQGERLTRIEATQAEHGATLSAHGERLIRIEAAQHELRERMDGLDAELRAEMHAARADLSRINERMARTEGTVAGALGRPLPRTHDAPGRRRSRRIVPRRTAVSPSATVAGRCAIPYAPPSSASWRGLRTETGMDPDLAGFIGLAALMVTLVAWLRIDMGGRMDRLETAQGKRMDRIEATLSEHGERLARIEAVQTEQGERLTRVEATQAEHGAMLSAHGERLTRIEATQAEQGERLIRIEAAQNELRERMDGLDAELRAELHAARADLSRINERMARTEGTVAGALGRPFPELTTRPADAAAAAE